MTEKLELFKVGDLIQGEMRMFKVSGKEILVARFGDEYYATDNRCPHLGGQLVNGNLNGSVVTCPLHGSQFDLKDGSVLKWTNWTGIVSKIGNAVKTPKKLRLYRLIIDNDVISIELPR